MCLKTHLEVDSKTGYFVGYKAYAYKKSSRKVDQIGSDGTTYKMNTWYTADPQAARKNYVHMPYTCGFHICTSFIGALCYSHDLKCIRKVFFTEKDIINTGFQTVYDSQSIYQLQELVLKYTVNNITYKQIDFDLMSSSKVGLCVISKRMYIPRQPLILKR